MNPLLRAIQRAVDTSTDSAVLFALGDALAEAGHETPDLSQRILFIDLSAVAHRRAVALEQRK